MRRAYEKPVMTVERFYANVAATGCQREPSGETETSWPAQTMSCQRSGSTEIIFAAETTACIYNDYDLIYIQDAGTYTQQELSNLDLTLHVDQSHGGSVVIPDGGGYVMSWNHGNCFGIPSAEVIDIMTSSY